MEKSNVWKSFLLLGIVLLLGLFSFYLLRVTGGVKEINYGLKERPVWRGLQPGRSTREDMLRQLGEPLDKEECDWGSCFHYPSDNEILPHVVAVGENDKVSSIWVKMEADSPANLADWVKRYGQAEGEFFTNYAQGAKKYIFATRGESVIADKESGCVFEIQYFVPVSFHDYLDIWGEDLFSKDPFLR